MMMAEMRKVRISDTGMEYSTPSKPKNTGSSRVGGIAVRPQVAGVGDKDLVYDVVKRTHQQGDNAGDGVLPHELAYTLRPQKLISGIHKNHLSFKK